MQAAATARRLSGAADRHGLVAIGVDAYLQLSERAIEELRDRTLLLVAAFMTHLPRARAALIEASARAPRPHVLVTFRGSTRSSQPPAAREARAAYGVAVPPDITRLALQVDRAEQHARSGCHAAAERLLRETAAALMRRRAAAPAARAFTSLGRLLLERGRAADANAVFDDAAEQARAGGDDETMLSARVWQAGARCDLGRLTEAEAICRAALIASTPAPILAEWARAMLLRTLLWQERLDEAAEITLRDVTAEGAAPAQAAFIDAVAVRALLARGSLFEAGQRAGVAVRHADLSTDHVARALAHTARLRVVAAAGDLAAAASSFEAVAAAARAAHAPLRLARARLVWHAALRRAGCDRDAERQLAMLARLRTVAPPLLWREIDARVAGRHAAPPREADPVAMPIVAGALIRLAHDVDEDAAATRRIAERVAQEVRATRVDLLSSDAGPVSVLLSLGTGLTTRLGSRVLDAGITIGPETQNGGHEIGVPVRLGTRLLAAFVARWPLDRMPPANAAPLLQLAAAIAAPRVDSQLAAARLTSAATISVPALIGPSAAMNDVRRAIARAAPAPFNVLIEGESGTGKELAARALHHLSPRRERRLCDVNCAALAEELLDSELFGHARGAFTGAVAERAGLFEDANGGTLFLDEIADLSPRGQAKLLRVLQQHEVRRVGETFSRKVDVRLVAAANRDMQAEAEEGRFRRDLLYRLEVIRIHIPPLRERPEDVVILAQHFWRDAAPRVGTSARLTHATLAALTRYHWPGNVRELQNVIAALAVAAPASGRVRPLLLPAAISGASAATMLRLEEARAQCERRCVEVALARAGGNRSRAARELGVTRQGLLKMMNRLGMAIT
jgi:two-component system response regulator HydG